MADIAEFACRSGRIRRDLVMDERPAIPKSTALPQPAPVISAGLATWEFQKPRLGLLMAQDWAQENPFDLFGVGVLHQPSGAHPIVAGMAHGACGT